MDRDDAIAARKAKEEERRKKDLEAEQMQWAIAIVIIVMFVGAVGSIKDLTDQCKSVVITKSREALDSTSFGNTGRQFVGGLTKWPKMRHLQLT